MTNDIRALCIARQCTEPAYRRWLCKNHYRQSLRDGEPLPPTMAKRKSTLGYFRLHENLGKAADYKCVVCGAQARDWAYDKKGETLQGTNGLDYAMDPKHYSPMCRSCHIAYDRKPECPKGHTLPPNKGYCRECNLEYSRETRRLNKQAAAIVGLGFKAYIAQYTASRTVAQEIIGPPPGK